MDFRILKRLIPKRKENLTPDIEFKERYETFVSNYINMSRDEIPDEAYREYNYLIKDLAPRCMDSPANRSRITVLNRVVLGK